MDAPPNGGVDDPHPSSKKRRRTAATANAPPPKRPQPSSDVAAPPGGTTGAKRTKVPRPIDEPPPPGGGGRPREGDGARPPAEVSPAPGPIGPAAPGPFVPWPPGDDVDEAIAESDDLLRAARDAQCLGRLAAAQGFLYLAHARLIGLGRGLELLEPASGGVVHDENVGGGREGITSDGLARSAGELLRKHTGKGMRYDADAERRRRKGKGAKGAASNKSRDTTPPGEISSSDEGAHEATAPSTTVPRTLSNCAHLDARRLVHTGMWAEREREGDSATECEDEGVFADPYDPPTAAAPAVPPLGEKI